MTMCDPIADMLTRIKNGGKAKLTSVDIPGSKIIIELAKVLKEEGYIKNHKFLKDTKQGILRVYLKYDENKQFAIVGLERVSKLSRRVYTKSKEIKPVLNGLGVGVLSTSKGIMSDRRARQENVGGETILHIW